MAIILVGAFVMFTFKDTSRGILYGAFLAVFGNLMVLSYKFIKYRSKDGETVQES